ncbi:MAG: hypothetical protein OHK0053_23860 [Microscillaceae bacterium]
MRMNRLNVIMPVYNTAYYLKDSIESILHQTFTDFNLIIYDDGSTDNSWDIIKSYKDSRIIAFRGNNNLANIAKARNICLSKSNAEFIAFQDSDDISEPHRLKVQLDFLQKNPDLGVTGSWGYYIFEDENYLYKHLQTHPPLSDEEIKINLFIRFSTFINTSVMLRASLFRSKTRIFSEMYPTSEDYCLWLELARETKFANIPDFLITHRIHKRQTTQLQLSSHNQNERKVLMRWIRFYFDLDESEAKSHLATFFEKSFSSFDDALMKKNWMTKFLMYNHQKKILYQELLMENLGKLWTNICLQYPEHGIKIWNLYFGSYLRRAYPIGHLNMFKYLIKCLANECNNFKEKINKCSLTRL